MTKSNSKPAIAVPSIPWIAAIGQLGKSVSSESYRFGVVKNESKWSVVLSAWMSVSADMVAKDYGPVSIRDWQRLTTDSRLWYLWERTKQDADALVERAVSLANIPIPSALFVIRKATESGIILPNGSVVSDVSELITRPIAQMVVSARADHVEATLRLVKAQRELERYRGKPQAVVP